MVVEVWQRQVVMEQSPPRPEKETISDTRNESPVEQKELQGVHYIPGYNRDLWLFTA